MPSPRLAQQEHDAKRRALVMKMALHFQDEIRAHLASKMPSTYEMTHGALLASIIERDGPLPERHHLKPHVAAHLAAQVAQHDARAAFNEQAAAFNARIDK